MRVMQAIVSDLDRSREFYSDVMGCEYCAKWISPNGASRGRSWPC